MAKFYFTVLRAEIEPGDPAKAETLVAGQDQTGAHADLRICHFEDHLDIILTLPDPQPDDGFEISLPLSDEDAEKVKAALTEHRPKLQDPAAGAGAQMMADNRLINRVLAVTDQRYARRGDVAKPAPCPSGAELIWAAVLIIGLIVAMRVAL
jgi:hypothetical protein